MADTFAIIWVGFPGIGKTFISKKLVELLQNTIYLEIDMFYKLGKSDLVAFNVAIHEALKTHNVIIGKNHHTLQSLNDTIDIMNQHHKKYYVFNFVPEHFETLEKEQKKEFVEMLLDRIERRNDNSSPLKITDDASRKRAQQIIYNGFVKKYEPPKDCIYLDYTDNMKNLQIILNTIEADEPNNRSKSKRQKINL
jgi:hypothetical protein